VSLARVARSFRADVLHSNGMTLTEQTYLAGRLARAKVVCHVRDLCPILGARWLRRFALNHCDRVVAISDAVRRDLVEKISVRPQRVTRIHDGRDLTGFGAPVSGEGDFFSGTPIQGCKRVGVVARLSPEKGHEHFLRAAAEVARTFPNVGFAIVGDAALGDGRYADGLVALAQQLGIGGRTVFTGFTDRIPEVMASLDILVVPSDAEPFGLVTVEAMASGKPVVATCTGGSSEIVVDGETGLLVPPRRPEAIADALVRLLATPGLAAAMGRRGALRAQERFSIRPHAQYILSLYRALLG
jgi:glycosyltransferase involved in cell wall biosynthesis